MCEPLALSLPPFRFLSLSLWTSSFLFHSYASPCCHSFTPPAQLFVYVHSRRLFKKVFTHFPFAKFLYWCYFTSPTVSVSVPDTKNVRMTHEYVIAAVSNSYINAYVQYRYCFFCYHVHLSLGCWCFFPSFACAAAAAIGVVVVFLFLLLRGERQRAELALFVSLCRGNCIHVWFGVRVSHNREKRAPTHAHSDSIIMCIMHFVHLSPCTIFFVHFTTLLLLLMLLLLLLLLPNARAFFPVAFCTGQYMYVHICVIEHTGLVYSSIEKENKTP